MNKVYRILIRKVINRKKMILLKAFLLIFPLIFIIKAVKMNKSFDSTKKLSNNNVSVVIIASTI